MTRMGTKTSEVSDEMRRIVKVRYSFDLLSVIFSGKIGVKPRSRIEIDAPSDLKVVAIESGGGIKHGWSHRETAWLYFTSATFEPVAEGGDPPEIEPFTFRIVSQDTMLLTEAYRQQKQDSYDFARCPLCQRVFVDNVMVYGSLKCPDPECGAVLERGIKDLE